MTIGTITAGSCRVEYAVSTYKALTQNAASHWLVQSCGPYLDMGRNDTVRRFYTECGDDEFLLFVDTDIEYTPDDIRRLVGAATRYHDDAGVWPVVGGLYQSVYAGGRKLVAYRLVEDNDGVKRFYPLTPESLEDVDDDTLMEIEGLGTGFMLIHRDILDHFAEVFEGPQEWFYEGVINANAREWAGEDLFFCMRALSLGHPVFAHSGVRLTHYKEMGLAFAPPAPPTPDTQEIP